MITYPTLEKLESSSKGPWEGGYVSSQEVMEHSHKGCWCEAPLKNDGLKTDPVCFFGVKRPLFSGKQLPSLKLTVSPWKEGHQSCKHQFAEGELMFVSGRVKKTLICIMFDAIPAKVPKTYIPLYVPGSGSPPHPPCHGHGHNINPPPPLWNGWVLGSGGGHPANSNATGRIRWRKLISSKRSMYAEISYMLTSDFES